MELDQKTLKALSKRPSAVHKNPSNVYQHFMNAYLYVYNRGNKAKTIKEGQTLWRQRSNDRIVSITVEQAAKKLKKERPTTLEYFFNKKSKVNDKDGATTSTQSDEASNTSPTEQQNDKKSKVNDKDGVTTSTQSGDEASNTRPTEQQNDKEPVSADNGSSLKKALKCMSSDPEPDVIVVDQHQGTVFPTSAPTNTATVTNTEAETAKDKLSKRIKDGQISVIEFMCSKINVDSGKLLSEDIITHDEFMQSLSSVASSYKSYKSDLDLYNGSKQRSRQGSQVTEKIKLAESAVQNLATQLSDLAATKIESKNLQVQLQSVQLKLNKLHGLLPTMYTAKGQLEEAIPSLKAAIRAQKARRMSKLTCDNDYNIIAGQGLSVTWEEGVEKLTAVSSNTDLSPLSVQNLLFIPTIKDLCHQNGMCGIPIQIITKQLGIDAISKENMKEIAIQVCDVFPLLCIEQEYRFVFVDYTEMIYKPGLVYELLTLGRPEEETEESEERNEDTELAEQEKEHQQEGVVFSERRGPKPIQARFPQILDEIRKFVQLHGFAAHARRRSSTATSCGVTIEDIRQHLLQAVDGLNKISRSKVYNLLQPARSGTSEAARHVDAVDVRVGVKQCNVSKENPMAHEYFAQVANVRQMCATYPKDTLIFSCDSKAKIHIGGQAVSRYHQLRTFFPTDDMPNYNDHDFPIPGYLIEPDGYLRLCHVSDDIKLTTDNLNREVPELPHTGPLFIYNRCVKNTSTNIQSHVNDIRNIISRKELKAPVLCLITDGGPDWTPKSSINQFFMGHLWRDEDLDMLVCACEPAGLSRFNMIEHCWSWCSRQLAGVSLPTTLSQDEESQANEEDRERLVLNNALDKLNTYWDGKTFDNFKVSSVPVYSDTPGVYSDYDAVKATLDSSLKNIADDEQKKAILEEWKFYVKHMDRRRGMVVYRKESCDDSECPCKNTSPTSTSTGVLKAIPTSEKWLFPPIGPDPEHPGHYMTFKSLCESREYCSPDQFLPDVQSSCSKCRYVFTSKTDEERHLLLIHGGKRSMQADAKASSSASVTHVCRVCNQSFSTRYQLRKHQSNEGHKSVKGRSKMK